MFFGIRPTSSDPSFLTNVYNSGWCMFYRHNKMILFIIKKLQQTTSTALRFAVNDKRISQKAYHIEKPFITKDSNQSG